jgi:hypothetical protein
VVRPWAHPRRGHRAVQHGPRPDRPVARLADIGRPKRSGEGYDEDQLAFLRDEIDYRNPTLAELPRGDFAFTVLRNLIAVDLAQADVGTPA